MYARYRPIVVRVSDLQLNGRAFYSLPPHYRSVGTEMGDRLRASMPPRYVTSHSGPTQPPTVCGTETYYRPKCGDVLRLRSKGRMAHSIRE